MLNEHVGVVLKDVMDGKGKRLEINVRPVLATKLQIILEGREVHAGLNLVININVKNVSRHRNGKDETLIIEHEPLVTASSWFSCRGPGRRATGR